VGLPPCWSAAEYDGPVRAALLAYKEQGRRALAPVLGRALGVAVAAALADRAAGVSADGAAWPPPHCAVGSRHHPGAGPVWLVPIPSTAAAVRARGGDHLDLLARAAAAELRASGCPVQVVQLLGAARRRRDSAGLDAGQRRANAVGAFRLRPRAAPAVPPGRPGRVGPWPHVEAAPRPHVVLVDDLITTGATLAEAAGVLRTFGITPVYAAVIAATVRRTPITACRDARHALTETGGDGMPPSG
jgi:predicted amidophosphoribosyltransferase